jgi:hypothetical protein
MQIILLGEATGGFIFYSVEKLVFLKDGLEGRIK